MPFSWSWGVFRSGWKGDGWMAGVPGGRYEETVRMMQGLVPWNDAHKLHAIMTNICPELLMPGAVIDVKNLLLLDQRIDFVSPRPAIMPQPHSPTAPAPAFHHSPTAPAFHCGLARDCGHAGVVAWSVLACSLV